MDQMKIGAIIQKLRKEKGLTQEQLAEQFRVSRRTVSRWETGSNMPDLAILIELSDFFEVSIRELLNGERNNEEIDNELKQTVMDVAEYNNSENEKTTKVVCTFFVLGILALIVNQIMFYFNIKGGFIIGYIKGSTFGLAFSAMVFGIIYTAKNMEKIKASKKRILKM
ncbi:helix-turn-helix domain-containing protein [Intestinibacter sp.]